MPAPVISSRTEPIERFYPESFASSSGNSLSLPFRTDLRMSVSRLESVSVAWVFFVLELRYVPTYWILTTVSACAVVSNHKSSFIHWTVACREYEYCRICSYSSLSRYENNITLRYPKRCVFSFHTSTSYHPRTASHVRSPSLGLGHSNIMLVLICGCSIRISWTRSPSWSTSEPAVR